MSNIKRGSGNVFADIGLPDPETHLAHDTREEDE